MSRSNASAVQRVSSVVALVVCFLLPLAAHAATDTVGTLTDSGPGSLRDAITNATAGDTINFQAGLTGTITLGSTLTIAENLTIQGPGANVITVSGNNAVQVFNVTGGTITISGLTIANGLGAPGSGGGAPFGGGIANTGSLTVNGVVFSGNISGSGGSGGGISNHGGTLVVTNSTFTGNSAGNEGGGIFNESGGILTVINSTFSGNTSDSGSGIQNLMGTATVSNSTFYGNSTPADGGGIANTDTLTVNNSIFAGNSAFNGGGIYNNHTANVSNSVFFNNSAVNPPVDCFQCTSNVNEITTDPKLLPLGNYGGSTQTMLPQPGSSAICAGSNALVPGGVTTDQRGFPLSPICVDAGAVQTNYLLVANTNDSGTGSLRAAVTAADTETLADIGFSVTGTITLSSAPLSPFIGQVDIIGPGAGSLTVSGGNSSTVGDVFTVDAGATVWLSGLTIANGDNTSSGGGGISNTGTLTISNSAITSNTTTSFGGGINSNGTLTVSDSTISGNSAVLGGGGILNAGPLTVIGSTFFNNSENTDGGGAIFVDGATTINDSTFAGNIASAPVNGGAGGAVIVGGGALAVNNSIFTGNMTEGGGSGAGIYNNAGTVSANNNLFSGNLSAFTESDCTNCAPTNSITGGSALAPLANYGGPTQTMLPQPGSAAICGANVSLLPAGLTTDQRGFARINTFYFGTACVDVGAVQTDYQAFEFDKTRYNGVPGLAVSPAPVVQVIENGQNIGGIPVTISFNGNGTATGLGPVTTVAGTGATFSNLSVDTKGESDSLSYVVSISPPGFSDAQFTAEATLDITAQPPVVSVAFSPATILPGGTSTTTMTVTVTNPNAIPLTGISLSNTLPSGLVFDGNAAITCPGTIIVTAPANLSLTSSTLSANGTCTVSVPLHATTAGVFTDVTGAPSSNEADTGTAGSGTLTVVAPPVLSVVFGAPSITYGGTTTLTYTLTNPNSTVQLTGIDFSDVLPAGLAFATSNGLTNTCGVPLLAVGTTASMNAVLLLPNGTCTASVNVQGVATGTQSTTTSTVTSSNGGTGLTATASVNVTPAVLTVTAASPTILFGTALPAYTANITNFVNGDTSSVVSGAALLTTTPSAPTAVGMYTITAAQGTLSATNYTFTFVNGLLTISKAATAVTLTQTAPATSGVGTGVNTTFTATVNDATAGSTGTPTGSVQFFDGAASLGTVTLSGGVAMLTTTFSTVTTHLITAVYSGDGSFTTSTSLQFSEVVVTPGFSISSNPTSLSIAQGGNGTATLTLTPVGNYTGTIALNCTGLPAFSSCQFLPATITFTGNNVAQAVQLTVFTLNAHAVAGASASGLLWLPAGMLVCLIALRRRRLGRSLLMLALAAFALAGITGCGSSATFITPTGNNTVTISATGTNGAGVTTQTAVITVTITQ